MAFCVLCRSAELGLSANRAELEFHREHNLGRKPLQIDLLVVEKRDEVSIKNENERYRELWVL